MWEDKSRLKENEPKKRGQEKGTEEQERLKALGIVTGSEYNSNTTEVKREQTVFIV